MEKEKGKKQLEDMKCLDGLIGNLKKQIVLEENRLTDKAVHYKEIQVQSSAEKDKIGSMAPKIVELKEQLQKYEQDLCETKKMMLETIKKMNPLWQQLLILRYMQGMTIEKTAEHMQRSYVWTWKELKKAEEEFEKIKNIQK